MSSSGPPTPPRAGFWRRILSFTVDGLVVTLPFQIAGAILFAVTSGYVQQSGGGITATTCWQVEKAPDHLVPPPPANSNFARRCTVSLLGHVTASYLQVGRVTQDATTTRTVHQTYMLDNDNESIDGWSVDWLTEIALIAYLIFLGTRGGTLGDAMMNIRLIDAATPEAERVPLRKVVVRYLAMTIGFLPMFALLLIALVSYGADAAALDNSGFFPRWFPLASIPAFGWMIWIFVQWVRKHDPIYDQIAGTAVIKN